MSGRTQYNSSQILQLSFNGLTDGLIEGCETCTDGRNREGAVAPLRLSVCSLARGCVCLWLQVALRANLVGMS
eukprot:5478403-Amphidinium_carterae.2